MGPAFYIMAILGCGDSETMCEPVRIEATHYASAEACEAATGAALGSARDVAFPVVMARCQIGPPAMAQATAATPGS